MVAKGFYYGSILITWIVLFFALKKRTFKLRHLFLWITYSLYSLTYEMLFGVILHLYYYITPETSAAYIIVASLLLYPVMIILYSLFLPRKKVLWYTMGWILLFQMLELLSIYTRTVVLIGWEIIPWSPVTYLLTYLFVYWFDGILQKKIKDEFLLKRG